MFVRATDFFKKMEFDLYERMVLVMEDFNEWDNKDSVENFAFFVCFFEEILYLPASGEREIMSLNLCSNIVITKVVMRPNRPCCEIQRAFGCTGRWFSEF